MKSRRTRIILIAILAAAAALAAAGIYASSASRTGKGEAPVETSVVESRRVDSTIEVSGNLEALNTQDIRAPVEGVVSEVLAKVGDRLQKGDAIARMNTASAEFAADQVRYQIDQEEFSGNRRKLQLLQRELAAKQKIVDDLVMKANIAGTLSKLDLKSGDVVTAGSSYGRVIDTSALIANVEIGEADISRARVGQKAEFRFPALPGLLVTGRILSFPPEARINDRGLVVLPARLIIDNPPSALLPAFSFNAVIAAGESREVLVVDSRAVSYQAGKPFVQRKIPGQDGWESVKVETEGFGGGYVRIVSGAAAGDVLKIIAKDSSA